jgi:Zn-dependent protease
MYFKFLNIPVYIHPSFWIFLIFFTNIYRSFSVESLIVGAVMFVSLLVHEYGHALTAYYFGARPTIVLEAFGGRAQYSGAQITPKQHFLITLNGPLFESVLILISYALLKSGTFADSPKMTFFLYVTMRVNIVWCLLNLIPMMPLDGGQLVRYFLEMKFGRRGFKISLIIGLLCAAVAIPYLFFHDLVFFGTILLIFAFQHVQLLKSAVKSRSSSSFQRLRAYEEAIQEPDPAKAKKLLLRLLRSRDAMVKANAAQSLAGFYVQEKQDKKAYALLLNVDPSHLNEGKCLLCRLAFQHKNYALVKKYGRDVYTIEPTFEHAVMNSKAYALLNEPDMAVAWLQTASQFGESYACQLKNILQEPVYDQVRDQEAFKNSHF